MSSLTTPWSSLPSADDGRAASASIRRHSKSFSLASQLLPAAARRDAHALYAYCRRADDLIDLAPAGGALQALERLQRELVDVYAGGSLTEPALRAFQRVVFEREIPRSYPDALLRGFELDARGTTYATLFDLHHYGWCVAGSVGAMMCHVLGVRREQAVRRGAQLGMGMQLTNICRDFSEDWARGRLYVPAELLASFEPPQGWPPPPHTLRLLASAVEQLLREAELFYRAGDAGLPDLEPRARLAVATARHVYSSIGDCVRARRCDVSRGRAVVPLHRKLWCVARAAFVAACSRDPNGGRGSVPRAVLRFPDDVLPI